MAADAVHVTLTLTFGGWRQAFRAKYLNAGRAAVSFAAAHKGWSFVTLIEFFGQWKGLWSSSSERAKLADDHFSMACLVRQFHFWREATQHGLQPSRATVSHELPRIYERELQRDSHQRRALEQRLVEMQREVDVLRAGQRTSQELARPDVLPPPAEVLGLGRRAKSAHHFFVSFFARIMLGYPLGSEVRAECRAWLVYGLWIMMLSTFLGCILSAVQYISAAAQSRSLPCSTPIRFWFLVLMISGARFVLHPIMCGYLRFRFGCGPVDSGSNLMFPNDGERLVGKITIAFDFVWLLIGGVCWISDLAATSPATCNLMHPEEFAAWGVVLLALLLHCVGFSLSLWLVHRLFALDSPERVHKRAVVHPSQQPV